MNNDPEFQAELAKLKTLTDVGLLLSLLTQISNLYAPCHLEL